MRILWRLSRSSNAQSRRVSTELRCPLSSMHSKPPVQTTRQLFDRGCVLQVGKLLQMSSGLHLGLISTCLVCPLNPVMAAHWIATGLAHAHGVTSNGSPSPPRKPLMRRPCLMPRTITVHSTSDLDNATESFILHAQVMNNLTSSSVILRPPRSRRLVSP